MSGSHQQSDAKTRLQLRIAFATIMIALIMVAGPRSARTQGVIAIEPKVKAAYIYKFIRYTTWPEGAFKDSKAPFVIGVVGKDPVNRVLRAIAKHKKAGARPIEYRVVTEPNQIKGCHIVFFGDLAPPNLVDPLLDEAIKAKQPTLLVGETLGFAGAAPGRGGTIEFILVNRNIKLIVSRSAAKNADLKISSQLMKLAEVIP